MWLDGNQRKYHDDDDGDSRAQDFLSIYAFQRKWKPTNSHRHSSLAAETRRSLWIDTKDMPNRRKAKQGKKKNENTTIIQINWVAKVFLFVEGLSTANRHHAITILRDVCIDFSCEINKIPKIFLRTQNKRFIYEWGWMERTNVKTR